MSGKYWPAVTATFLAALALDWLFISVVMGGAIGADPAVRPFLEAPLAKLIVGEALFAVVFVWIYAKGVEEGSPVAQGLRYGLAVALLYNVAGGLVVGTVLTATKAVVTWGIVLGAVRTTLLGVLAAAVHGSPGGTAAAPASEPGGGPDTGGRPPPGSGRL